MADDAAALMEEVSAELYDQEVKRGLPAAVFKWIDQVLEGDEMVKKCPGLNWDQVKDFLQDGVVLCRLINRLRDSLNMRPAKTNLHPDGEDDICIKNVESFLEAAHDYGVRKTACFAPRDLVEGRKGTMLDILFCLTTLGHTANSQDFEIRYEPPSHPAPAQPEDE